MTGIESYLISTLTVHLLMVMLAHADVAALLSEMDVAVVSVAKARTVTEMDTAVISETKAGTATAMLTI